MKNIEQVVKFPAASLLVTEVSGELKDLLVEYTKMADKTTEEAKTARDNICAKYSPKLKAELTSLGAELPTDLVSCHLSLGIFLFDTFLSNLAVPQAPLAKHIHQKKVMDVAAEFDKEDFEIPLFALKVIQDAMLNMEQWSKVQANIWVEVEDNGEKKKRFISLTSAGINFFQEVMDAALGALYTSDLQK